MSSNRRDFLKGSVAAAAIGGLGSIAEHGQAGVEHVGRQGRRAGLGGGHGQGTGSQQSGE